MWAAKVLCCVPMGDSEGTRLLPAQEHERWMHRVYRVVLTILVYLVIAALLAVVVGPRHPRAWELWSDCAAAALVSYVPYVAFFDVLYSACEELLQDGVVENARERVAKATDVVSVLGTIVVGIAVAAFSGVEAPADPTLAFCFAFCTWAAAGLGVSSVLTMRLVNLGAARASDAQVARDFFPSRGAGDARHLVDGLAKVLVALLYILIAFFIRAGVKYGTQAVVVILLLTPLAFWTPYHTYNALLLRKEEQIPPPAFV